MTESGDRLSEVRPPTAGLTSTEVQERVAAGLTNAFEHTTSRSAWSIVRANTLTLFNAIILVCFVTLLAIGRWPDALFGFTAMANAIIGSVQEFRAKRALDRLTIMHAPLARVIREGAEAEIAAGTIVVDDSLVLRAGDRVAADAVLVTARGLQIDESMLTGESDAVEREAGDRVLSGSVVIAGEGLAVVDRVGADAFANSLAAEARRFSLVASELRSSINRLLGWITWIVVPVALLVLNAQMVAQGGWDVALATGTWRDAATATVASVVAMVPLGLVLMTSIAFAVGAVKLSRQQVLVQELAAVEGLARVDLICIDKTGTLTDGQIVLDDVLPLSERSGWERVLAWYGVQPDANATAGSLAEHYTDVPVAEPADRVAFSSERKWSAVVLGDDMWVLGGPEMVFPARDTGDPLLERLAEAAAQLTATGRRVLVLACGAPNSDERIPLDAVPVALLAFRERIRPDAAETLAYFAEEGVQVRVISGDNPQTAAAIARAVGLDADDGFDARELPDDDDELRAVLERHLVLGRVTPQQKRRIVQALQAAGHTVAMTGDGVNDALAIKEADIGIAMNSGAAATKAVARLVLLDGQFSRLPGVVAEGRKVIANIERVSMIFLTKTAYATLLAITFGVLLQPFPFLPRQLSLSDGLMIGIPAFFLALLPNLRRYVPGFLRRSLLFAVPAGIVVALGITVFALVSTSQQISDAEIRTGATLLLTVVGLWILIVLSRPIGALYVLVLAAMLVGLLLSFIVPIARDFLLFVDLSSTTIVLVSVLAAACIALIEVVRFVHRRVAPRRTR